jgi:AcrR family transcriptional regulator
MKRELQALRPRVRKRKGEGGQRRTEILEAAKKLFVEEGYDATTIRRIATRVGISSTALYVYFPNKNAVLTEICNETFARLIQELDAVRRDYSDSSDALAAALQGYIRFGLAHSSEYQLTFLSRESTELHKKKQGDPALGMLAFERFYGCVDAVVRSGRTHETDTNRLTQQLWAGAHGLTTLLLLRPGLEWGDLDSLIAGHVAMLMRGLEKPQGRV